MGGPHRIYEQADPFEGQAEQYDDWFDTPRGRSIFNAELECLRPFVTDAYRPWLEVGVGTGCFAEALGVEYGIDPSQAMLDIAAQRGIKTQLGVGEKLSYPDQSFGGMLLAFALCFVADPSLVL